jgi:hypothetical protein
MRNALVRWSTMLALALATTLGCASHGSGWHGGGSPDMETRTYLLRDPGDSAVVNRVLDEEYKRSGVRSSSSVTPGGDIVVQTTPRGHAAVRAALGREGR